MLVQKAMPVHSKIWLLKKNVPWELIVSEIKPFVLTAQLVIIAHHQRLPLKLLVIPEPLAQEIRQLAHSVLRDMLVLQLLQV